MAKMRTIFDGNVRAHAKANERERETMVIWLFLPTASFPPLSSDNQKYSNFDTWKPN